MDALTPETMRIIWLLLVVILLVIELITVGLTTIWFAAGSAAAFLLSLTGAGIGWQTGIFLAVSIVLLIFTRPWALRYVNRNREKTNYESMIGKTVKVTQRISNTDQTGAAVYDGQEWTARSLTDDRTIEEGKHAVVEKIEGVKLIVREKEEK
ncbi:NfeD family protein [Pseudoflavonifractor sp. BSD2780061688st1 E11]|uniref:NfeD family protein n=1 Tax=Oscillospiraceae TaxID=216572 RepID=UPI00325AAF0B